MGGGGMGGYFDGIENAVVSGRLSNLAPNCSYVLGVDANKVIKTRSKGNMAIAEFTVVESSGPGANPPGTRASYLVKLSLDTALGNIKGYAAALLDEPVKNITSKISEELFGPANPAKGNKVRCQTVLIQTKAGSDFTRHDFAPYAESATPVPMTGATTATKPAAAAAKK